MTITDEEFVVVVKSALTRASVNEIANRLSVSLPTITRWANNQNLPMQATRKAAVKELGK
jgi:transposase